MTLVVGEAEQRPHPRDHPDPPLLEICSEDDDDSYAVIVVTDSLGKEDHTFTDFSSDDEEDAVDAETRVMLETLYPAPPSKRVAVLATLAYDYEDPRYAVLLDTCQAAAEHRIPLHILDRSNGDTKEDLVVAGTSDDGVAWVQVVDCANLKTDVEAIRSGLRLIDADYVAIQAAEHVDLLRQWPSLVESMSQASVNIGVPRRTPTNFALYYPAEQYHADSFANHHLNALARKVDFPAIDWTWGAMALDARWIPVWLDESEDEPLLSTLIQVQRNDGAKVASFPVDFALSPILSEIVGTSQWSEERLQYMNHLFQSIGTELAEDRFVI